MVEKWLLKITLINGICQWGWRKLFEWFQILSLTDINPDWVVFNRPGRVVLSFKSIVSMSRSVKPIVLIVFMIGVSWRANAQVRGADSLYYKSYLKADIGLIIADFTNSNYQWFGIQYEHLIGKKLTLAVSGYIRFGSEVNGGTPTFEDSKQISFVVMPQLRYYVSKQAFKGCYVGLAPYYQYIDTKYDRGVLLGAGGTSGYQFFIKRKFPIDISLWAGEMFRALEYPDYGGEIVSSNKSYFVVGLNIYAGFPVGKKRK
jgi:hypothetical protein